MIRFLFVLLILASCQKEPFRSPMSGTYTVTSPTDEWTWIFHPTGEVYGEANSVPECGEWYYTSSEFVVASAAWLRVFRGQLYREGKGFRFEGDETYYLKPL